MNDQQTHVTPQAQAPLPPAPMLSGDEASIAYYARHPEQIDARLAELDREWDAAELIAVGAAGASLLGLGAAISRRGKMALLPLIVAQAVLLRQFFWPTARGQAVVRRLGLRGRREIEAERYALKALRGDFQSLPASAKARGLAIVPSHRAEASSKQT